MKAVAEGVQAHPEQMAPAMKLLKGALLDTGRFARLVPILETACRDENAPAALWAALARIYEKLGRRDDALRLIGGILGQAGPLTAFGSTVAYNAIEPEAYRGLGFPGAEDLGNMFQFKRDFNDDFCGMRNTEAGRSLNPEMQTFKEWLSENKERIPVQ